MWEDVVSALVSSVIPGLSRGQAAAFLVQVAGQVVIYLPHMVKGQAIQL